MNPLIRLFPFPCYPLGDFTERHPPDCGSQLKYRAPSFPDLPDRPGGFDAGGRLLQLQAEWCRRREDRGPAVEGQAVSRTARRRRRAAAVRPATLVSLACRPPPPAPGRPELLAPHGQRLQRLDVAPGETAGGDGRGQTQRWLVVVSSDTFVCYLWLIVDPHWSVPQWWLFYWDPIKRYSAVGRLPNKL